MARKFRNLVTSRRLRTVRKAALWMTNRDRAKIEGSAFQRQYNQAKVVGSAALPLTCDRDDPRKSIIDGTDVLADVAGLRLVNGIFVVDPLKGDENLVDTDITAVGWNKGDSTVSVTDYEYKITVLDFSNNLRYSLVTTPGESYCLTFLCKKGTKTVYNTRVHDFTAAAEVAFTINGDSSATGPRAFTTEIDATSYSLITVKFTAPAGSVSCGVYLSNDDSVGTQFIKNVRCVESSACAAGFPDGSPALTDYAKDILTFLHTFTATATLQFTATPYGWSDDGNPVDAECVLFESGAFRLKLSAAGFIEIDGTVTSTKKLLANTLSVITVKYDGVNHTLQVDGETPVVAASAIIPSGTSYVGDNAAGTKTSHAVEHIAIYDDKLMTAEQITIGEEGYQAKLGDLELT